MQLFHPVISTLPKCVPNNAYIMHIFSFFFLCMSWDMQSFFAKLTFKCHVRCTVCYVFLLMRGLESRVCQYICIRCKPLTRFACGYSLIYTVLWNYNMHIKSISILTHSLFGYVFTMYHCTPMRTHTCTHVCRCARNDLYYANTCSYVCRGQSVTAAKHAIHISVCRVLKWNYEQRLYGQTDISGLPERSSFQ